MSNVLAAQFCQGRHIEHIQKHTKSSKNYSCLFVSSTNLFHQQNLQLQIPMIMFWKIQEIFYLLGTEIFKFGPAKAEQIAFKDCNLYPENINWWSKFSWQGVPHIMCFVLEGQSTFIFEWNPKVGGVSELSCHELSNVHWNFVNIPKNDGANWVWRGLPIFEKFSWTGQLLKTPTLFKPNYLSLPWSNLKYFSAHQIENFLNFSKHTQLLSVG